MIEVNKNIRKYIKQLPQMGLAYLLVGIACFWAMLRAIHNDSIIDIPFIVLGILLGYLIVYRVDPGARVNFWFFSSVKMTDDQKTLYDLVVEHRSRTMLIAANLVIILVVVFAYSFNMGVPVIFNLYNAFWFVIWTVLTIVMLDNGIKYIASWWKIRKDIK